MSYATVMVHVDGKIDGPVTVAADLAGRFDAHLIGIASATPISVILGENECVEAAAATRDVRDMKALLDEKAQQFRAAVGTRVRRVEWRALVGPQTDVVAREARAADLLVIGNVRASRDPFRALDPGSLILKAGRPVLVVPNSVTSLPAKRIAVAWKDVREARRAVQDALPFLQQAENVMIVEVAEPGGSDESFSPLRDVVNYLVRHGIETIVERVRPADVTVANSLLRLIEDENINLIVAGGYGHSRLGEWAYGGVTRDLLAQSPICCLFSH